jgi:hypothetical protein
VVKANSTITFTVNGVTQGYIPVTAKDVHASVADRLSLYFDVIALTITPPNWVKSTIGFDWLHWPYSSSVTIKTRVDHGDIDDVRSVIANAYYLSAGAMPSVSVPALGESQGPATESHTGLGEVLATIEKKAKEAAKQFEQYEMIIVLGVIGVVALIMFSPAGKAGARSLGNVRLI